MKKIIITLALAIGTLFTSCTKSAINIEELRHLKTKYEIELELLEYKKEMSQKTYMTFYEMNEEELKHARWDDYIREKVVKDSLEIIDIEIQRYINN